jgi:hypothetical protein
MRGLIVCLSFISSSIFAETSMPKVLEGFDTNPCYNTLVTAANETIKQNQHRLMATYQETGKMPHYVSGVIEYKDRLSQVMFAATESSNSCKVVVKEAFTVKLPCITVRQEVFKRWQFKGKLSDHTMVVQHMRKPNQKAILSDASDGTYCLVTRLNEFK